MGLVSRVAGVAAFVAAAAAARYAKPPEIYTIDFRTNGDSVSGIYDKLRGTDADLNGSYHFSERGDSLFVTLNVMPRGHSPKAWALRKLHPSIELQGALSPAVHPDSIMHKVIEKTIKLYESGPESQQYTTNGEQPDVKLVRLDEKQKLLEFVVQKDGQHYSMQGTYRTKTHL